MKQWKTSFLPFLLIFGVIGAAFVFLTKAATPVSETFEPEDGTKQGVIVGSDSASSGGSYISFFGQPPATAAMVTPGAETNYDKLPYVPGTGRVVSVSANIGTIQTAINNAQPGDTIEVSDGTISGRLTMNGNATAGSRIILRAKNKNGVTITGCSDGCITIGGAYNVVQNFRFSGTGGSPSISLATMTYYMKTSLTIPATGRVRAVRRWS